MTLDDLVHWIESDDLVGTSLVIANVDGLQLPIEKAEVRDGKLVIFVDMYSGYKSDRESREKR